MIFILFAVLCAPFMVALFSTLYETLYVLIWYFSVASVVMLIAAFSFDIKRFYQRRKFNKSNQAPTDENEEK